MEFVDMYGPMIFRFVRSRGLQDADAADLVQEVLRRVGGSIERLEYAKEKGGFPGPVSQACSPLWHADARSGQSGKPTSVPRDRADQRYDDGGAAAANAGAKHTSSSTATCCRVDRLRDAKFNRPDPDRHPLYLRRNARFPASTKNKSHFDADDTFKRLKASLGLI